MNNLMAVNKKEISPVNLSAFKPKAVGIMQKRILTADG